MLEGLIYEYFLWFLILFSVIIRVVLAIFQKAFVFSCSISSRYLEIIFMLSYFLVCIGAVGLFYGLFMHKLYDDIDNYSYLYSVAATIYFVVVGSRFSGCKKK